MRCLLDTHTLIWTLMKPAALSAAAVDVVSDPANSILFSPVSISEIAIKYRLGRVGAPPLNGLDAGRMARAAGCIELALTVEHAAALDRLPLHHADPFDRLLIAQAQVEQAVIVSRDAVFERYGVKLIVA